MTKTKTTLPMTCMGDLTVSHEPMTITVPKDRCPGCAQARKLQEVINDRERLQRDLRSRERVVAHARCVSEHRHELISDYSDAGTQGTGYYCRQHGCDFFGTLVETERARAARVESLRAQLARLVPAHAEVA